MVVTYYDYKTFLRDRIAEAKPKRGFMAKLAKFAGCQRSYLSQVLSSHIQLTPDQAFALARFFGFNRGESEYFRLLVDLERCSTLELRAEIKSRLEQIRSQQMKITERINTPKTTGENHITYYSSWIWSAIHYITSIPEMQTSEKIAERLHLPPSTVAACLEQLVEMKFVIYEGGRYKHSGEPP
ncbi:MAG: TIGR02147 family protein [Bdellovibrionales bacterium]|nr:TIGR02147 family protein [Bdellovibrionales bacterium]